MRNDKMINNGSASVKQNKVIITIKNKNNMYKPVNYKAVGWFLLQKIKGRYLVIKYLPL